MSIYRQQPNYTSKPTFVKRLGKLLFILLILAGIASAIFLIFFRGYVVDTPHGPRLELPFLAKKSHANPVFSEDSSITVPEESKQSMLTPLHAIRLSLDSVMDGTVQRQMEQAECNAVILDMRSEDGSLHYVSDLSLAIESESSAALPGLNEAIRSMNRNPSLYTIARVSCFPDAKLAASAPDLALQRASGVPWRDSSQTSWLSPHCDVVQNYLFDICRELADLGFDEILLTNCAYPTQGARSQTYGSSNDSIEALSVTMEDFYQEMRSILDAEAVHLSILWEPSPTNEEDQELSGQKLDTLILTADRVWMENDYEDAAEVFSAHGLSFSNPSLVSIRSNFGNSSFSWAIL